MMQPAVLYNPRALLTPTERKIADERRARLIRMLPKPLPQVVFEVIEVDPYEVTQPPIPNSLLALAQHTLAQCKPRLKIADIQEAVARHFGVTVIDIVSARRTADVVWPRQIAVYLARTLTTKSLPEIGRAFGGRDHSTSLHAIRKVARRLEVDEALRAAVAALSKRLGASHA
jgi:chromosomal replication initiation ATPase DnaA